MKVRFTEVKEYIEELTKESNGGLDPNRIAGRIVRITNHFRPTKIAICAHVFLIATAKNARGEVVMLEHFCGELWQSMGDKSAVDNATKGLEELDAACQRLNLVVRAGVYEE